jgi:hypothetical protein
VNREKGQEYNQNTVVLAVTGQYGVRDRQPTEFVASLA